jgi:hypothetical protein
VRASSKDRKKDVFTENVAETNTGVRRFGSTGPPTVHRVSGPVEIFVTLDCRLQEMERDLRLLKTDL